MAAAHDARDEAAEAGRLGKHEDLAFHMEIARAAGNDLFAETMEMPRDDIRDGMDMARGPTGAEREARVRIPKDEHGAMLDAIADSDRARVAMRAHLQNAQRRIVGSG